MDNFSPLVSIVIPVYNGSNYLKEAIDSATAQTYENTEIIVLNDGSTDDGETEKIALSYGDKIKYFSKKNGGVASALNVAIKKSKGEYISWLSHDDMYEPEKLKKQIEYLESIENRQVILYTNYSVINKKGDMLYKTRYNSLEIKNKPLYAILRGRIHGCSMLIPKECFEEISFFDESKPYTQDYDLWFKFIRKIPFVFMDDCLIMSRAHAQQGSKTDKSNEECCNLWNNFIENITTEEMVSYEGSRYLFVLETLKFLKQTAPNYQKAIEHYKSLLNKEEIEGKRRFIENRNSIKVSVIIPFYNHIDWLKQAITSVLNQTFEFYELILVDDGSTEQFDPEELTLKDARIKYLKIDNSGPAIARNKGMDIAKGTHIAFLDSDDLWEKEKLEQQLEFMEITQTHFSHSTYKHFGSENDIVEQPLKLNGNVFYEILKTCTIATPTVILAKKVVEDKFRFPENMKMGEDVCLWISIADKYAISCLSSPLTSVRMHGHNVAKTNTESNFIGLYNIVEFCLETFEPEKIRYSVPYLVKALFYNSYANKNLSKIKKLFLKNNFTKEMAFEYIIENFCKFETTETINIKTQGVLYRIKNIIQANGMTSLFKTTLNFYKQNGLKKTFKRIIEIVRRY